MTEDAILRQLGFSDYEARAYAALLRGGLMNGYEVAKAAQVPRPNVYAVLEKLAERGAARRVGTRSGVRYGATPPAELIERLERGYADTLAAARRKLEATAPTAEFGYVWNVHGYNALQVQANELIDGAANALLIGVQAAEAAAFAAAVARARARSIAITTLCMDACAVECGGCEGELYRCFVEPAPGNRALIIVADNARLLAAEITSDHQAFAIRTEERLVVELAAAYIRQSIALAALTQDLGARFDELLSPATRRVLAKLSPAGDLIAPRGGLTGGPDAIQ